MGFLANSRTERCQGRQVGDVTWLGVPMYYCLRKEGVLIEVSYSCDLSLRHRVIS